MWCIPLSLTKREGKHGSVRFRGMAKVIKPAK